MYNGFCAVYKVVVHATDPSSLSGSRIRGWFFSTTSFPTFGVFCLPLLRLSVHMNETRREKIRGLFVWTKRRKNERKEHPKKIKRRRRMRRKRLKNRARCKERKQSKSRGAAYAMRCEQSKEKSCMLCWVRRVQIFQPHSVFAADKARERLKVIERERERKRRRYEWWWYVNAGKVKRRAMRIIGSQEWKKKKKTVRHSFGRAWLN